MRPPAAAMGPGRGRPRPQLSAFYIFFCQVRAVGTEQPQVLESAQLHDISLQLLEWSCLGHLEVHHVSGRSFNTQTHPDTRCTFRKIVAYFLPRPGLSQRSPADSRWTILMPIWLKNLTPAATERTKRSFIHSLDCLDFVCHKQLPWMRLMLLRLIAALMWIITYTLLKHPQSSMQMLRTRARRDMRSMLRKW